MKPHDIRFVSVSLTNQVGANDSLIAVRVVPMGRIGNRVLGRTLTANEEDTDQPISFYPYRGEELHFPPGSIQITVRDLDRLAKADEHGYAHLSNIVWTWLFVGAPPDPMLFRFLVAAARRLDTAHALFVSVHARMSEGPASFTSVRQRFFEALAVAEVMCVALARAVDMLRSVSARFGVAISMPPIVTSKLEALREIRDAFEHIDERALGNRRTTPHQDALSVFDQKDFITSGVLRYGTRSLDLTSEVPHMLVEARRTFLEVAVAAAGAAKTINGEITFGSAPPGSYERILERAYFLWRNRTGSNWWDAESNWHEAERADMSVFAASAPA